MAENKSTTKFTACKALHIQQKQFYGQEKDLKNVKYTFNYDIMKKIK